MPIDPATGAPVSGGIHVGDVGGNVSFRALGDIVGGDKIVNISTTIQISVEAVTQRPLITASPYRGLDRFEDRDKDLFFGRDQLIRSLLAQLGGSNILLVLGPSGSGKSSVVRAGLLPALSRLLGRRFRAFTFVPDTNPFESLRSSLQRDFSQDHTRDLAHAQPESLARVIRTLRRDGEQWLLFVDQFEELFTRSDERLRRNFIEALLLVAQDAAGSTKLVLAMRADFLDRFSVFPPFARSIEKNITLVADMQVDELRLAIEQPAAQHGVVFEPGLVEEIIKDVQGQAGSLPLLQYTLDLLWEDERRSDRLVDRHLNTRSYRELGGVRGALQKRADEIYAALGDPTDANRPSRRQEIVRQIFLRLVDIAGVDADDPVWRPVRRRVPIPAFGGAEEEELVRGLVNEKLLVSNREDTVATVEVAHEALFTCWQRLRNWIEGGKQVIFVRNRLADDARRWHRHRQEDSKGASDELLAGSRLGQALEMQARGDFVTIVGGLSEIETQFLSASAAARDQRRQDEEERQRRELQQAQALAAEQKQRADEQALAARRQRRLSLGMVVISLLTIVAAVLAWKQKGKAEKANAFAVEKEREASSRLAEASWLVAQPARGAGFAENETSPIKATHYLLRAAAALQEPDAAAARRNAVLAANLSGARIVATLPLDEIEYRAGALYSPDGETILTWNETGTAQLWRASDGEPVGKPMRHTAGVLGGVYSPNGQRVLTWSGNWFYDGNSEARLWRAADGEPVGEPMQHVETIRVAAFSADGQNILTWCDDQLAHLWNANDGRRRGQPIVHITPVSRAERRENVSGAFFIANGRGILTWNRRAGPRGMGAVRLWRTLDGQRVGPPDLRGRVLDSSLNSAGGDRVVICTVDAFEDKPSEVQIWSIPPDGPLVSRTIKIDRELVAGARLSPDCQHLLIWRDRNRNNSIQLWDVNTGRPLGNPVEVEDVGSIRGFAFTSDGQRMLGAWTQKSPGESRVAWGRVANGLTLEHAVRLGHEIQGASFSPDGQRVLTWTGDLASGDKGEAQLWSVGSGQTVGGVMTHEDDILGAMFDRDGRRVLTWSPDGATRVWNAEAPPLLAIPALSGQKAYGAHFSSEGQIVLVGGDGPDLQGWDMKAAKSITLPGSSAGLSSDGQWLLTLPRDASGLSNGPEAQLWELLSGKRIGEPMRMEKPIDGVQFSKDGQRILAWSASGTIGCWETSTGRHSGQPANLGIEISGTIFGPGADQVLTWTSLNDNGELQLWRTNGQPIGPAMKHDGEVHGAALSPNGRLVVAWNESGKVKVWQIADGKPVVGPLKHGDVVGGAAFSPDSRSLLTWCEDDRARLWRVEDGRPIGQPLKHAADVDGGAFSRDGGRILTWSEDGTARLWSSDNSQCIAVFNHGERVVSACFADGDTRVVTVCQDGRIRQWDISVDETISVAERVLEFEVRSATTLGFDGQVRVLRSDEWEAKRSQLAALRTQGRGK